MSALSNALGMGVGTRPSATVTASGSHTLSSLGVPADRDVQLQLVAAGGGGAAGNSDGNGGGGGGGGGGAIVVIPAALWALGGTLVLGAHGNRGIDPTDDGTDAADSTLTINSVLRLTCGGGKKGTSVTFQGGAGGVVTVSDTITTITTRKGYAGQAGPTSGAAAGGLPGMPGGGKGGAGGAAEDGAGADGGAAVAILTW